MSYANCFVPITGILILGFFLTSIPPASAQVANGGARAAALGGAATALDQNSWTPHNPALAGRIDHRRIELSGSQSFGLAELQAAALALIVPVGRGVISSMSRTFGFSQFRNTQIGLGYARRLSSSTLPPGAVGILLIYDHTAVAGYDSETRVGGVIGGSLQLSSTLLLGVQAANVHRSLERPTSTLPQRLGIGAAYRPAERVQLLVDLQKDVRYPLAVHAGIEFHPIEALALRTGITTVPRLASAGVGLSTQAIETAVAFVHHYALGWSPVISLGLRW